MYNRHLREIIPPPSQNTVGVCNQITLLILHYISSSMVTLLKVTDAPIQVSDTFILLLVPSSSILILLFPLFVPNISTSFTSYIVQITYTSLFGSSNDSILACFH